MMPPTMELEVERMKVCLPMKSCYSMSGGMCDSTLSMYTIDTIRIRILIVKYLDFRAKMELVCKRHAYFQVVKDDN